MEWNMTGGEGPQLAAAAEVEGHEAAQLAEPFEERAVQQNGGTHTTHSQFLEGRIWAEIPAGSSFNPRQLERLSSTRLFN